MTQMLESQEKTHYEPPLRRKAPLPVVSMAVACAAFALVLLIGETVGPVSSRIALFYSVSGLAVGLFGLGFLVLSRPGHVANHLGYMLLVAGVFYWFAYAGIGYALSPDRYVGDRYGIRVSRESITAACTYLSLFTLTAVAVYWLVYPSVLTRVSNRVLPDSPVRLPYVIFGLFILGLIPYLMFTEGFQHILNSLLAGRTVTKPWKSEGPLGDYRSAIYYFCISGFVAAGGFAGTWGFLVERGSGLRQAYLAVFAMTAIVMFFDGGTRSWVALAVVPTVLAWIAKMLRTRVTLGRVLLLMGIVCAVQLAFEIARASRHRGWSVERVKTVDVRQRHFDNDFFTDLAVSVELVPSEHPYFYAGDLVAFFTHPVPRFIWEGKPISPILLFYNSEVHTGYLKKHGNKLPSHIGQSYMSFGVYGVILLGAVAGLISAAGSAMIRSDHMGASHFGCMLILWWFLMSRGVYPGWTYPLLFNWLILLIAFRDVRKGRPMTLDTV